MTDILRLAVDVMGGDLGPQVTIPASLAFLKNNPSVLITFFGDSKKITDQITSCPDSQIISADRFKVLHCTSSVSMAEKPSFSVRNQKKSSMWQALESLKAGTADACISSGNTGSLMAMSQIQLGCIDGIGRPAICTKIPTLNCETSLINDYTYLLDIGANVTCSGEQLYNFSLMASQKASIIEGVSSPVVGLLNIGTEDTKGREELHDAAKLIKADKNINYLGYVEGDSLFKGMVDIAVCDGFTGNIVLKTIEGLAFLSQTQLKTELSSSYLGRLGKFLAGASLRNFYKKLDPSLYNGATFLGLNNVVVKSHGSASIKSFYSALSVATTEAKYDLPCKIEKKLLIHKQ